jgi:hypothetical protein
MLRRHGLEPTREQFIDANWAGQPPEEWGPEEEEQLPPHLCRE